jgi:hypothetical protein
MVTVHGTPFIIPSRNSNITIQHAWKRMRNAHISAVVKV